MISHDRGRGQTVQIEANYSILRLPHVTAPLDSGNYTCAPHNLRPDIVAVHILGGGLKEVAEETAAAAVQDDDNDALLADFHSAAAAAIVGADTMGIIAAVILTLLMVSR